MQLHAFDGGSGTTLYWAGDFDAIGGVPAGGFARWDGQRWQPLGRATTMDPRIFITYDRGQGPELYLYGTAYYAPETWVGGLLRWNGEDWDLVGEFNAFTSVNAMTVFDDGRGPALYLGGGFPSVNGVPARNLARYDGRTWEALGAGTTSSGLVRGLAPIQTPRGPALMAIGYFDFAGAGSVYQNALWVGCPNCYADCDLSGSLNVNDFMCFVNKFAARRPEANCTVDATIDVQDFVCYMTRYAQGCP